MLGLLDQETNQVAANKASAACNDYLFTVGADDVLN